MEKKVRCVDNISSFCQKLKLTIGKEYDLICEGGNFFSVANDVGDVCFYDKELFEKVERPKLEKHVMAIYKDGDIMGAQDFFVEGWPVSSKEYLAMLDVIAERTMGTPVIINLIELRSE